MHRFRMRLILLTTIYTGAIGIFCLISPFFRYPLKFPEESIKVLQLILPVFIGFLVAGVRFYTTSEVFNEPLTQRVRVLFKLLNWSFSLFAVLTCSVFLAFGLSGSRFAEARGGMDINDLMLLISLLLTLLTGTVGAMVNFAFPATQSSKLKGEESQQG